MEIVGKAYIEKFQATYPASRTPLNVWVKTIESGSWKHFAALKKTFGSVDYVGGFLVFDIKGNHYRLITVAIFHNQQIIVKHVFTHQEYDKWWRQLLRNKGKKK